MTYMIDRTICSFCATLSLALLCSMQGLARVVEDFNSGWEFSSDLKVGRLD